MKITTAIKKFEAAGAIVTGRTDLRNNASTYYAKFEKYTVEFWHQQDEDSVDTFAIPYAYDNGSQETLCFFRDTVKSAIACATR